MPSVATYRQTPILQALPLVAAETDIAILQELCLVDHRRRVRDAAVVRSFIVLQQGAQGGGDTIVDAGGPFNLTFIAGTATITNMPDAETEFNSASNRRLPAMLEGRTLIQAYAGGTVAGGPGSTLSIKYSLDGGANFVHFSPTPCTVAIDALAAGTQTAFGTEVAINAEAQTDVVLGIFTDGDATPTEDPSWVLVGALIT